MARRTRLSDIDPLDLEAAEVRWQALRTWSQQVGSRVDPEVSRYSLFGVDQLVIQKLIGQLEDANDATVAERTVRLEDHLRQRSWPRPPGEVNPGRNRTWLDSATAFITQRAGKSDVKA